MTPGSAVRSRGTIIKVPDTSPGLLIVNGRQVPFTLEGCWSSPVAPAANMMVEVDLDPSGAVASLAVVDSQQLAREKLDQLSGLAQQHGKEAAAIAKQGMGSLASRMGAAPLAAAVTLWAAWFFLPAVSIDFFLISRSFTVWEILGLNESSLMSPGSGSHGPFALLGLLAIAAPFAAPFVRHPRATLLNAAPLGYLAAAAFGLASKIAGAFDGPAGSSEFARGMAREVASAASDAVSIGLGAYLLIAAAGFLAFRAFRTNA